MHIVYFENKVINFIGDAGPEEGCGAVLSLPADDPDGITKVLEKLENNKQVCVKSDDPDVVFDIFCRGFIHVEAAGGLVTNDAGEYLMIFRNGKWDLPKGHLDEGETLKECAVREVKEECGLENVEPGELITATCHIYLMRRDWIMKRTSWFSMKSNDMNLDPQSAEGITEAEWISCRDIAARLEDSYSTIREVFRAGADFK